MNRRGEYSQRQKLAHHTKETECSSLQNWQTPTVMMPNETPESFKKRKEKNGYNNGTTIPNLQVHVVMEANWPTATVAGLTEGGVSKNIKMTEEGFKTWRDGTKTEYGAKLRDSVIWMENGQPDPNNTNTTGKPLELNPDWVEQLMGLPIGWTALDY